MIDLKQIQYFVACAQSGSFSEAAESLYTTQPSVSKVIKSMEEDMNLQLFERRAKGICLTPDGERVYHYAKTVMEYLEKMQAPAHSGKKERLLVSSNPSSWFADRFVEFYHEHERDALHYQIYSAGMQEIVKRVQDRTDDIGFLYVMKNQLAAFQYYIGRNYLEFETLLETDVMLYQGRGKDTKESREKLSALSDLRLVQRFPDEFSPDNYWEIKDQDGNSASEAEAVVTTNSDYIMNRLLETSDLVNISGAYLNGNPKNDASAVKLSDGEEGKILYGYVHRRGEGLQKWAKIFVQFLTEKISFDPDITE